MHTRLKVPRSHVLKNIYRIKMIVLPASVHTHTATAPFLLAMSEFVWRSGSCGSAVSIHHGPAAVGQFPIFPSL